MWFFAHFPTVCNWVIEASKFSGYFDLQNNTYFLQVDTQLFHVKVSYIPAASHCSSLIFTDFFVGWRKGERRMPFVSWTKETAWTSSNKFEVWIYGLPFLTSGFFPECSRLFPKEKLCLPQPVWYSISLITRYPRMYWDLTLGVPLTKRI